MAGAATFGNDRWKRQSLRQTLERVARLIPPQRIVVVTQSAPDRYLGAELAGLPTVTGLYTTIACLVGYAVFGPSRVLVLGPDSSISPLINLRAASFGAKSSCFIKSCTA